MYIAQTKTCLKFKNECFCVESLSRVFLFIQNKFYSFKINHSLLSKLQNGMLIHFIQSLTTFYFKIKLNDGILFSNFF